jgi:hypothetical protein
MLSIEANVPEDKIGSMIAAIDHFKRVGIGHVMSEWQTEDMHRHRPFTMRSRAKGQAATVIRPHSLFEVQRSAYAQRQVGRLQKLLAKPHSARYQYRGKLAPYRQWRRWSTRPILRSELLSTLQSRLDAAMTKLLKW